MSKLVSSAVTLPDGETIVKESAVGNPVPGATVIGGLPPGGATGSQLTKRSPDDGDVLWSDALPPVFDAGTFN